MSKTAEQQRQETESAIEAVELRGQRWQNKDREVWRADHASLDRRLERLERKAAREARGGVRVQRVIPL